ncbi:hypothetical protein N8D56_15590 [Devosia sp. A8/3-2]|nr:hypothetical protein N8D56_15590 [Devosia sp. A8/3-2]
MHRFVTAFLLLAAMAFPASAQTDAIGAPGPIIFENVEFAPARTSHPDETYFKQEYVPAGQTVEQFEDMFMIDVLTNGTTPAAAAAAMVQSLDRRKGSDPVINYDIIRNEQTGEIILDFLLSDSSSGTMIVEWNAYRYAPLENGTVLYAISRRGYGEDGAGALLAGLKERRQSAINTLAQMDVPEISLD